MRPAPMLLAVAMVVISGAARAEPLVADLSDSVIAITTGFAGSEVLLFGATEGEGDVIVVVRGPVGAEVVRRKSRVAGVWVNRGGVEFDNVPSFYHVAASAPLAELLPEEDRRRLEIGHDYLGLRAGAGADGALVSDFRAALVRAKQRLGLYYDALGEVTFLGTRLFRTELFLPSNVHTGTYEVTVYLVSGQKIVAEFERRLEIGKIGLEAEVFAFAQQQSALYGMIAILVALMAGWLAGFVFRRT